MENQLSGLLPEALQVDHPELDPQHEEIFVLIESLKTHCFDEGGLPDAQFERLLDRFEQHFSTEERLAEAAGVEFAQHARVHRTQLRTMRRALDEVLAGVRDVHSFLRFVEFWFERHIQQDDQPFVEALRRSAGRRIAVMSSVVTPLRHARFVPERRRETVRAGGAGFAGLP
ncbi:MAG: hemerythrin [Proteobacteria bacterium]|jgi:hemerythrin-like metal-binding protein|nr:hemerythrin [Pseudomonadota bacterium]